MLPAVEQRVIWLPAVPGPQDHPGQGPDVLRQRFSISRSVVNPSKFFLSSSLTMASHLEMTKKKGCAQDVKLHTVSSGLCWEPPAWQSI